MTGDAGARRLGRLRAVLRLGERADAGQRDVPFWRRAGRHLREERPPRQRRVLELGCGTGRVTFPLAREGVRDGRHRSIGRDAARAAARKRRRGCANRRPFSLVRGDIRHLPFPERDVSRSSSRPTAFCSRCCASATWRRRSRRCAACSRRAARSAWSWSPICRRGRNTRIGSPLRGTARQRRAHHADRIGPAGSRAQADAVRSGIRRATRAAR